ncbi:MAG TPA: hypothetical protein VMS43_14050 [Allosphingosinicella sp.]|nr:hypothetical protein [Allosphingosinicella sp.]
MAADIDELGVTVRQWRNRRDIPSRAWPKIIKAAAARHRILRLEDFLPPEAKSDLPLHAGSSAAEWPIQSATKTDEIICSEAENTGEGDGPGHPFSATSSSMSSPRAGNGETRSASSSQASSPSPSPTADEAGVAA